MLNYLKRINKILIPLVVLLLIWLVFGFNIPQTSELSRREDPVNDLEIPEVLEEDLGLKQESQSVSLKKDIDKDGLVIEEDLPPFFDLDVPFTPQAPFGDWSLPYQEACEEASMIMAERYLRNKDLNNQIMDEEIQKLVLWQKEKFGYYEHTTVEEVKIILEEYFNLKAEVSDQVSVERIKQELFQGNLVILPCSGQDLPNPHYKPPGPVYHMLVVRGWKGDRFITNDPGTIRGQGFEYQFEDLIGAVFDPPLTGKEILTLEIMRSGEKKMIIVKQ